ncbi:hypothetical protein D3C76_242490 [compost metagenome]
MVKLGLKTRSSEFIDYCKIYCNRLFYHLQHDDQGILWEHLFLEKELLYSREQLPNSDDIISAEVGYPVAFNRFVSRKNREITEPILFSRHKFELDMDVIA